jgi:hypothetical protein
MDVTPVEAESVEAKLFQPVAHVRKKEPAHLVFAVIEQERVPRRMLPPLPPMKVQTVGAVEPV